MKCPSLRLAVLGSLLLSLASAAAADAPAAIPDDRPADLSKPVKVFLLMGQSNMIGFGKIAGPDTEGSLEHATRKEGLYPYLLAADGAWSVRKDVRNVRVMVGRGGGMQVHANDWLTIQGKAIGPEIGIGHHLGNLLEEPVLLLKSCIGNRSLGWDLLPPGSASFEHSLVDRKTGKETIWVYAGYKQSPLKWEKGSEPAPIAWYAGKQYDDDTANARKVLAEIGKYHPGAGSYKVAGFFWWQGDKDRYDEGHALRYEQNLVRLIHSLRKDFHAPDAPFVLATLGQTQRGETGNDGAILDAMLAVDGESGKYPAFRGNVATVYTHPLSKGGASNGHYNGNAQTYMNVGEAMAAAMVRLLSDPAQPKAAP
jgi:hypothetical protein